MTSLEKRYRWILIEAPKQIKTKKMEKIICENCGINTPLETARMDDEDANWFCPKCVSEIKEESQEDLLIDLISEYNFNEQYMGRIELFELIESKFTIKRK